MNIMGLVCQTSIVLLRARPARLLRRALRAHACVARAPICSGLGRGWLATRGQQRRLLNQYMVQPCPARGQIDCWEERYATARLLGRTLRDSANCASRRRLRRASTYIYIYMAYAGLGTASHARRRRYVVAQGGPDLGMVEIDMYVF